MKDKKEVEVKEVVKEEVKSKENKKKEIGSKQQDKKEIELLLKEYKELNKKTLPEGRRIRRRLRRLGYYLSKNKTSKKTISNKEKTKA